jgi:hypothetical protein
LQAAVFAGLVDPGNLVAVREIVDQVPGASDCGTAAPLNCDTSVYAGPRSQYTISVNPNGSLQVVDTTSAAPAPGVVATGDGTDTLFNVERLQFSDQTVLVGPPGAPAIGTATAGNTSATVRWTAPASSGTTPITSYAIDVRTGTTVVRTVSGIAAGLTSTVVTGLTNGTAYNFTVRALNGTGAGPDSTPSNEVTPAAPPGAPTIGTAVAGNASATVNWTAPASDGGSAITSYDVRVVNAANAQVGALRTAAVGATSLVVTGLTNGTAYRFQVRAVNAIAAGPYSALSIAVTPSAPDIVRPTITARTPAANAVTVNQATNVTVTFSEAVQAATVTNASITLRAGAAAPVAATVTYNALTRVATLNPNANLAAATVYTVTVTGAVRDIAGNTLVPVSWNFATGPAPTITARTPAAGALLVSRTANITFTTSRPLVGVNGTRVRLVRVSTGATVTATVTVSGSTVTINPAATLASLASYRVVLAAGMTDAVGNPLAATNWTFTTRV